MLATISLLLSEGIRPFLSTYTVVVLMEFLNGFGTVILYISPFVLSKYKSSQKCQARITVRVGVNVMVFNATLNNISFISWRSVLLVEETRVPGDNHRTVANQ
jgi:hypothetical protein